jgi:hypothetical protein
VSWPLMDVYLRSSESEPSHAMPCDTLVCTPDLLGLYKQIFTSNFMLRIQNLQSLAHKVLSIAKSVAGPVSQNLDMPTDSV